MLVTLLCWPEVHQERQWWNMRLAERTSHGRLTPRCWRDFPQSLPTIFDQRDVRGTCNSRAHDAEVVCGGPDAVVSPALAAASHVDESIVEARLTILGEDTSSLGERYHISSGFRRHVVLAWSQE